MRLNSLILLGLVLALGSNVFASEGDLAAASHRETINKFDTTKIAQSVDDEKSILEKTLASRVRQKREFIEDLLRTASVSTRTRDVKNAEAIYLQVLTYDIPDTERRDVLLEMIRLYDANKEPAKMAAVLEKFSEAFAEDPSLPQVYIKLGILYRDMGLFKLSLARFYSVLNYSLRIDQSKIDDYKKLSLRAQLEIADTHFVMGQYDNAIKYYTKLRLLDLQPEDRAHALFQTGYCFFLLKNNAEAIANLETFVRDYSNDEQTPEANFVLANAYSRAGRYNEASQVVLALLKRQETHAQHDEKLWIYWQKKAGNYLANELFEQGDYSASLTLYQAMLHLSADADWQWPVLYQLGMCFEKLNMRPRSLDMYKVIVEWPNKEPDFERTAALDKNTLRSIYEMAQWRLGSLEWRKDVDQRLERLLDKAGQ